jgi:ABC-type branched-subunit amino acid transport system substrate-binding protein
MVVTRRTPSAVIAAASLCLALLATGCGTTVSAQGQAAAGVDGTNSLGVPTQGATSAGVPGSGTAVGPTTPTGTGGATTAPGASAGPGSLPGGTTGGAGTSTGTVARSRAPIEIGFLVAKCGNCDLLGSGYGQSAHSMRDILQALVNDQNRRGGLLGRKIVPIFAEQDTAAPDFNTMLQEICATFTQDHKVKAVVGAGFGFSEILANCLGKAGIPVIDAMRTTGVPDRVDLAKYPNYVISSEPMLDVYNLVAYTSGVDDGWLKQSSKLGVLNFDCPSTMRVWRNVIKPYLARQKIPVTVEQTSSCIKGSGDIGRAAQDVQQAVLKMQSNGVDVVAITDIPLVVFATAAETQRYRPKYLATEGGGPSYTSLVPAGQVPNIHAPGWAPSFDLAPSQQPAKTAAQRTCLANLTRGGLSGQVPSEHVLYFALCGAFDLYVRSVARADDVSTAGVLNAVNTTGSAFTSPYLLDGQTLLGPTKHAAAVRYRTSLYNASCSCFTYVGPARPLPSP